MSEPVYQFDLYRLNIVDEEAQLFDWTNNPIRDDDSIRKVLKASTASAFDETVETERATVKWSLRQYVLYTPEGGRSGDAVGLTLARSLVSEVGPTVKDDGIEDSRSETNPPIAKTVQMTFYMTRHIVAVERNSSVLSTQGWRQATHQMFAKAATEMTFTSTLQLEPIAGENEIISTFRSFSKLMTLKVHLRIPNPEVDRITKRLMDDMTNGGVRDYLHRMHNPNGLNQSESAIPFAAASLAQAGYKDGEVMMDGIIAGKRKKKRTGLKAARSSVESTRDFVRGALSNAKSQETKKVLASIMKEIDRTSPPSSDAAAEQHGSTTKAKGKKR